MMRRDGEQLLPGERGQRHAQHRAQVLAADALFEPVYDKTVCKYLQYFHTYI